MDCEKVRDRFSSLWEKELTPIERKIVKEHLSSCPACQREFKQFEKTMRWLHSAGEVEVPDEFLPELHKKMEERKRITPGEKATGKSFNFPLSLKLPAQAVAMVAIVFLVLYLTKMTDMEGYRPKETEQKSSPLSLKEKSEQVLPQKEVERARGALKPSPEAPRPKDVEQAKTAVPREERLEAYAPQVKAEAKKAEAPSSKTEMMGDQTFDLKGAARTRVPSSEPEKVEKGLPTQEKLAMASKPPQEIVLRISDREKAISQLHELVKQFGGEIVTTEGNRFLASLPTGSFSEFEKELSGLSASAGAGKMVPKKHVTGSLREVQGVKGEEVDKKSKEAANLATDEESRRTIVRILLVQE
jgi:hypothetical protein